MKRLSFLLLLACLWCHASWAGTKEVLTEPVSLSFDRIPVPRLIAVIYGDLLRENFAMSAVVLERKDVLTVNYSEKLDIKRLREFSRQLLSDVGLIVEQRKGYLYIRPVALEEGDADVLVYRPKYRTVAYLSNIVTPLFRKNSAFSAMAAGVLAVGQYPPNGVIDPLALQQAQLLGGHSSDVLASPQSASSLSSFSPAARSANRYQSGSSLSLAQSTVNNTITQADVYTFSGDRREVERVSKLLDQIDTPVGEVIVRGAVYEVSDGVRAGSAVSLAVDLLGARLGVDFGGVVAGASSVSFKSTSINAVFSVLDADNRFRSVSNPSLRVISGRTAKFAVGSDVPILGSVSYDKSGNPIQSVEYRSSGVIFNLTPKVLEDRVELELQQQISNFVQTQNGVNSSPTLIKRELSTVVSSGLDDVLIIGGLDEEKETDSVSGPSFFPSVLRNKSKDNSKSQILLVLQVQKI